ncbi:MAG: flagellar motor protein MotB [Opitutaceae bacterium]|nr:flagellar motor protein MotB [Opitutaceae bacterium]
MAATSLSLSLIVSLGALAISGCYTTDGRDTNARQPGPAVGTAIGTATGAVVGNVAGAVVAAGESASAAAKVPFNGERRIIREWRTETTPDGRTIRVPYETEVDAQGRPIGPARPAKY